MIIGETHYRRFDFPRLTEHSRKILSLGLKRVEDGTTDRSHRAYPKWFEMFIPIHAFRGRRNPPFAMQAKFLKTLLRNSTAPGSFVVPYAGFDAINLPHLPFPSPPSLFLSLSIPCIPEHRDTKSPKSTRALDKTNARRKAPEGPERCRRVSGSVHKFSRFRSVALP